METWPKIQTRSANFSSPGKVLSHVADQRGVLPDPDKVSVVAEWPVPTTTKQLKAFSGSDWLLQALYFWFCKNCTSLEHTDDWYP